MTLTVDPKFCKGCGICVAFCPKHVLELDDRAKCFVKEREKCIACGQCELRCPDFAITLEKLAKEAKNG